MFFLALLVSSVSYLFFGEIPQSEAGEEDDITISSSTNWAAGSYTYRDITVTNNSTLTLEGTHTDDTDGYGVTISARNIIIESGSSISATGQGYAAFSGPGKPATEGNLSGGAGYGGKGGQGRYSADYGGETYGSAMNPTDLGSGAIGVGGGAIIISCDSISIEGVIGANGPDGSGGSGGSINIQTTAITGSGSMSANGGSNSTSYRGGGGGGRIAVFYESSVSTFNFSNVSISGGIGRNNGFDGTVFTFDKELSNLSVSSDLTLEADQGLDENGDLTSDGVYNFNNLTVSNSATLTLAGNYSDDTDGTGTLLNIAGDVTVETGSSISAEAQGYAAQDGQGSGVDGNGGSGGGYGGVGGNSVDGVGGNAYGSALFPEDLGSGGGNFTGGAGGGLIKIVVEGDIEIQSGSEIDASGSGGYVDGATEGGGGSGGSIYLVFNSISGDGTISADGGTAPNYAGGGGGGRVALYGDTSLYSMSNISVTGGTCGSDCTSGSDGTVFVYDTATGNVEVSNDLTLDADQGVNPDGSLNTDGIYYFNNLTVTDNSTLTLGGYYTDSDDGRGVTLNLDGDLTVSSGSKISADGQGYVARSGSGAGYGNSGEAGSGGTYGGFGGVSADNGVNPNTYGNEYAPYNLGSGSGIESEGASGGGAIVIRCLGDVVVDGVISANGSDGSVYLSSWATGGGSGGSIFLFADNVSGSGLITASGGGGGGAALGGGGGGGGGRVAIVYYLSNSIPTENVTASGGNGSISPDRDGSDGTVYIEQKPLPDNSFRLKNPNNDSYEFTNTKAVSVVPDDAGVDSYYENGELPPTVYADGWHQISEGKNLTDGEGVKTIVAWLKDENELISSSSSSASITLDETNPTLDLTTQDQEVVDDDLITVSGSVSDNLSGVSTLTYQRDLTSASLQSLGLGVHGTAINIPINQDGTFDQEIQLSEGVNQITFNLTDKAGNSVSDGLSITESVSDSESDQEDSSGDSDGDSDSQSDEQGEEITGLNIDSQTDTESDELDFKESEAEEDEELEKDRGLEVDGEDGELEVDGGAVKTNYYIVILISLTLFLVLLFLILRRLNHQKD